MSIVQTPTSQVKSIRLTGLKMNLQSPQAKRSNPTAEIKPKKSRQATPDIKVANRKKSVISKDFRNQLYQPLIGQQTENNPGTKELSESQDFKNNLLD